MTYLKHELNSAINKALDNLKDQISSNLLNYELSILYRSRADKPDVMSLQNEISRLSGVIDDVLNRHRDNCLQELNEILEEREGAYTEHT